MQSAIEVLRGRRSVRAYTDQPVPRSVIEEIVDCGRLAPTAMNQQPWDFVVVADKADLGRIPPILDHNEFIASAAFAILVVARESLCPVEDCCAATENLLLAAAAHGIGSCWITASGRPYAPRVAAAFGVPADRQLIAIGVFGYPAENPQVEKRPLADVLHWDHF